MSREEKRIIAYDLCNKLKDKIHNAEDNDNLEEIESLCDDIVSFMTDYYESENKDEEYNKSN